MAKKKLKVKKTAVKKAVKKAAKKPVKKAAASSGCGPTCGCGGGCAGPNAGPKDVLHGMYVSYDPETGFYIESNYDNGLEHGEHVEYFDIETEFVKTRGFYEHGLKQGQWIHYLKDGSVEKLEKWEKGRKKN